MAAPSDPFEPYLNRAAALFDQGDFVQAGQIWQAILKRQPTHPVARAGLYKVKVRLEAGTPREAPAPPPAQARPDFWAEPKPGEDHPFHPAFQAGPPAPVDPPRALTTRSAPVRAGLKVPGPLKGLGIPPTTPRNAGLALGLLLTLGVALFFLHDHLQEAALKRAVLSAKAAAMNPVSRQVQIEVLTETPEAVRKEAQDALSSDPLLCYFRIQECLRADPVDPGAAQLLEQAKTRLGESRPSGDLGSFQKSLQAGDLESAETCILGLLRQAPDTDDLKEKARTVSLLLAQYFAAKDRFSHARERLLLVRAMYPQEKIWQAKIRLLEAIQNLPRADRAGWIPMLG